MKLNRKTIVFFNGFYIPHLGGVERYTSKLVEQLKKYYNIIIVTSNDNNYEKYEIDRGIKIYRLPVYNLCKSRYPLLKKNKEYKDLIKRIKSEEITTIICNTRFYQTSLLGARVSKFKNCPLIFIDHSSNHVSVGNKLIDKMGAVYEHYLTNKIKKYNPKFYGVSKKCNEWLKHFDIESSGVFYNSIDEEVFEKYYKKSDNNDIIISYIGRIIPEKGIYILLDAFCSISEKYDNIKLYIAGEGPILESLNKKYNYDNINFLGKIDYDDVMKLCAETDIFVHPSMYPEGLPTSILEAGIMKSAVIATDRGGTCEVIISDNIGLIVEEKVDDLIEKIKYLLDNPKKIDELKNNIHKRIIENFTWQQTAKVVMKEIEKYEK